MWNSLESFRDTGKPRTLYCLYDPRLKGLVTGIEQHPLVGDSAEALVVGLAQQGRDAKISGSLRNPIITIQGTLPGTCGEVSGGWGYKVRRYSWSGYQNYVKEVLESEKGDS